MEFDIINYILKPFHLDNVICLSLGMVLNFIIPWKHIEMECKSPILYVICALTVLSLIIYGTWPVLSLFVHIE